MTKPAEAGLRAFQLLWESYLPTPNQALQDRLLVELDTIQKELGLSPDEWKEFTATLTGFDSWWDRVRGEAIDALSHIAGEDD